MPTHEAMADLKTLTSRLAQAMLDLDSGDLARLRRMNIPGPGDKAFWRLAQTCSFIDLGRTEAWMLFVKILAILSPKGDSKTRNKLHDPLRRFGAVLCDGGDQNWQMQTEKDKPVLSERRLAQFIALPFQRRGAALERLARQLAANRTATNGINCLDIAYLLFSNDARHLQTLAQTYYKRLDTQKIEETAA